MVKNRKIRRIANLDWPGLHDETASGPVEIFILRFFFFLFFLSILPPSVRLVRETKTRVHTHTHTHTHTHRIQIENSSPSDNSRYVSKEPSSTNVSERAGRFVRDDRLFHAFRGVFILLWRALELIACLLCIKSSFRVYAFNYCLTSFSLAVSRRESCHPPPSLPTVERATNF